MHSKLASIPSPLTFDMVWYATPHGPTSTSKIKGRAWGRGYGLEFSTDRDFVGLQVPMCGYGGASKLEVGGVSSSPSGQPCLDLGTVEADRGIKLKVLLYNSGPRAAFVHATCCHLESSTPLPDSYAHLVPSQVIIPSHSTQEVLLYFKPDEEDVKKCRVGKNPLALLKIQSGDELVRQRLVWANEEGGGKEGGRECKVLDPACKQFLMGFSQQKKAPASSGEKNVHLGLC